MRKLALFFDLIVIGILLYGSYHMYIFEKAMSDVYGHLGTPKPLFLMILPYAPIVIFIIVMFIKRSGTKKFDDLTEEISQVLSLKMEQKEFHLFTSLSLMAKGNYKGYDMIVYSDMLPVTGPIRKDGVFIVAQKHKDKDASDISKSPQVFKSISERVASKEYKLIKKTGGTLQNSEDRFYADARKDFRLDISSDGFALMTEETDRNKIKEFIDHIIENLR